MSRYLSGRKRRQKNALLLEALVNDDAALDIALVRSRSVDMAVRHRSPHSSKTVKKPMRSEAYWYSGVPLLHGRGAEGLPGFAERLQGLTSRPLFERSVAK